MGNGKVAKERTAEPVPNVGAVRRIPIVCWIEVDLKKHLEHVISYANYLERNGKEPYMKTQGEKVYLVAIW